jgi:hypothetical protein
LTTSALGEAALAVLNTKLKRHGDAIAQGQQAVKEFLPFKNKLWTGDAYQKLGAAGGVGAEQGP